MTEQRISRQRRVIRDVEPEVLGDLCERPPRASVAFVDGGAVDVLPARARCRVGAYEFAVSAGDPADLAGREVVLVLDDGPYWFQLRGVSVRGVAERLPGTPPDGLSWYAIAPRRILVAFLRCSLVAQVATVSSKGRPFMTPLWFVVDRGALYFMTGVESRAGKNVAVQPGVVVLFHGEYAKSPARCLRLRGTATCHPGLPSWRILLRVAAKYYLTPAALLAELRHARLWRLRQRYYGQAAGGAVYVRVVPTAVEFLALP
jgi:hypothetical protein